MPFCLIIAGPNGAGKTTFARTFLPQERVRNFVNADLLAAGLSPLDPGAAVSLRGVCFFPSWIAFLAAKKISHSRVLSVVLLTSRASDAGAAQVMGSKSFT